MFLVVSKLLIPKGYSGLAIFPFVFVAKQKYMGNTVFINHEKIHIRQQLELLVFPFFMWYFLEFLVRLLQYRDKYVAYKNISFEREAYANEHDPMYLKSRNLWRFLNYL